MAAFVPQFVHDTLLRLAEAAYLPNPDPATDLPADYDVVGQITADEAAATQLAATAPVQHRQLLTTFAASGRDFGWVAQNVVDGIAIATFRGTQSVDDWLRNLDFTLAAYQPVPSVGMVHAGFQLCYMTIRSSLLVLLAEVAPTCRRLILYGHSLWAALCDTPATHFLLNLITPRHPPVLYF